MNRKHVSRSRWECLAKQSAKRQTVTISSEFFSHFIVRKCNGGQQTRSQKSIGKSHTAEWPPRDHFRLKVVPANAVRSNKQLPDTFCLCKTRKTHWISWECTFKFYPLQLLSQRVILPPQYELCLPSWSRLSLLHRRSRTTLSPACFHKTRPGQQASQSTSLRHTCIVVPPEK